MNDETRTEPYADQKLAFEKSFRLFLRPSRSDAPSFGSMRQGLGEAVLAPSVTSKHDVIVHLCTFATDHLAVLKGCEPFSTFSANALADHEY